MAGSTPVRPSLAAFGDSAEAPDDAARNETSGQRQEYDSERFKQHLEENEPADSKPLHIPVQPTQRELEEHEIHHGNHRGWCREDPLSRKSFTRFFFTRNFITRIFYGKKAIGL